MANNKSNTKVIKIAPEVDVAASNKTKQDIKKLIEHLNFTLTGVGKGLTEHGLDSFSKYYKKAISNITKEFEKIQPEMQKHIKSGFSEVAKYLNSIQKEFTKENRNLAKEAEKNLNNIKTALDSIGKSAEAAQRAINKLGPSSGVKILGQRRDGKGSRTYKTREERQAAYESLFSDSSYNEYIRNLKRQRWLPEVRKKLARENQQQLYESLFPQADRAYNLNILRQRKARENQQQLYESLFREADLERYRQRRRILPNIEASRLAREGSGFGEFFRKLESIPSVKSRYAHGQLAQRRDEVYRKLFDEAELRLNTRNLIQSRVLENIEASKLARQSSGFSQLEDKISRMNFNSSHIEKMEAIYAKMAEKGDKYLRDFSRRMTIYFSYKTIDLFTNSVTGAVDSLVKLQSAFANIQAITASTTGQMEKIRKAVFDVGVNTRFATEEVSDAAVVLGQAGLSTQEIASVLEHTATLASATGEGLKETAGLMTSVLSVWNMNADQASHVADVFVTSANETKATLDSLSYGVQYAGTSLAQLGVSFEETSAVMAASTNAGLKSSSMLGTGMRALATELTNQSKRMQDTLASLGLTFDDVDIQSLGLIKVLKNLKEAGFGATEAFAAFDRRAATYALAALSELDTAERLTEEFNRSGAAAKANATQMATLESQLISLQDIIAKGLSNSFRVLTELLTGLLSGINGFLKAWDGFSVRMIASATSVGVVTAALSKLKDIYRSVMAYQMITFRSKALAQLKKERDGIEGITVAMVKQRSVALALAKAWQVLKASFIWAALLTAASYGFDLYFKFFKSLEDQVAELNETMETHRSTVNSTKSDLEELSNKERLYTSDVEALNRRIEELNRKYADKGFIQTYADETDNLKDKLLELRDAIKEVTKVEDLRRAKAREEAAEKQIKKIESDINSKEGTTFSSMFSWDLSRISKGDQALLYKRTKSKLDEFINVGDYDGAKNYFLDRKKRYAESLKNSLFISDEEIKKEIDAFESTFLQYISANFEKARAELDRKGREQELRAEYNTYENLIRQQTDSYSFFVENSFKNITEALSKGKKIDDESITEAISSVNDYAENILLKNLEDLKSDMESKGLIHTIGYSNLLTAMGKYGKKDSFRAFLSEDLKEMGEGAFKDNQLSRSGYESIFGAIKLSLEELRKKNLKDERNQPRSTPFLDLRRNELSNIGESTKAAKKARDIRLKGFGYTTGLTSAAQGLYKGYSDEMSLLESALNAERYAKILKELETEYKSLFNAYKSGTIDRENLSRVEVTALDLMKDTENKLTESSEAYQILTGKTYEYGASLADLNVKYADLTMKTEELTSASTTGWNGFLEGFKNKYKEMSEQVRKNGSISNQIGELVYNSGISSMENALISICDRTKSVSDAFREMLADILKEIRNFLIKQAVQQFFMILGSSITAGGFSGTVSTTNGTTSLTNSAGQGVTSASGSQAVNPIIRPNMGIKFSAAGGVVQGGIKGKDSVHTMLMPGEYVMKKSAVDVLGTKFFNSLNTNAAQTMNTVGAMMGGTSLEGQSEPSIVNVWVVSEKDEAQMGPNDVIATISKDLQTGGTTKKLIQTIVAGRKA